jgi:HEAT repeat protein
MSKSSPPIWNGLPIPYAAPIAELREAVEEHGPKAWAAIRALVEKPDTEALETLVELSKASDPYVRRAAVEGIGIHRSGQMAFEVVCQALHDRDTVVVRSAVEAAANLHLQPAHERVAGLVTASEQNTQLAALRALEVLWQSSDFEAVFDRYLNDLSGSVRKQAAWTLHKNIGAERWERIFSIWSRDELPRHRTWACQLAGRFGSTAVLSALDQLRADPDGHVRRAAEHALEQIAARASNRGASGECCET